MDAFYEDDGEPDTPELGSKGSIGYVEEYDEEDVAPEYNVEDFHDVFDPE